MVLDFWKRQIKEILLIGWWVFFVMLCVRLIFPSEFKFYLSKLFYGILSINIILSALLIKHETKLDIKKLLSEKKIRLMLISMLAVFFVGLMNDMFFDIPFYFNLKNSVFLIFLIAILFLNSDIRDKVNKLSYFKHFHQFIIYLSSAGFILIFLREVTCLLHPAFASYLPIVNTILSITTLIAVVLLVWINLRSQNHQPKNFLFSTFAVYFLCTAFYFLHPDFGNNLHLFKISLIISVLFALKYFNLLSHNAFNRRLI